MSKTPVSKTSIVEIPEAKNIELKITTDEAEMLIDALEADHEGYVEAVKEARGNNNREDVKTFGDAAIRIQGLMAKIQELIGEE